MGMFKFFWWATGKPFENPLVYLGQNMQKKVIAHFNLFSLQITNFKNYCENPLKKLSDS